jgi:hypothetical protein
MNINNVDKDAGEEWNMILDHICQIRLRSQIIYLESLKTIEPEFENDYDEENLYQENFEKNDKNPRGFDLKNNHYIHEKKRQKDVFKNTKKLFKKTKYKILSGLKSFKKKNKNIIIKIILL